MSDAAAVEQFIIEEIGASRGIESLDRDSDLLASDVLDSLAVLELVGFLEERFEIEIADQDLIPENFQSVSAVVAFLGRKRAER